MNGCVLFFSVSFGLLSVSLLFFYIYLLFLIYSTSFLRFYFSVIKFGFLSHSLTELRIITIICSREKFTKSIKTKNKIISEFKKTILKKHHSEIIYDREKIAKQLFVVERKNKKK